MPIAGNVLIGAGAVSLSFLCVCWLALVLLFTGTSLHVQNNTILSPQFAMGSCLTVPFTSVKWLITATALSSAQWYFQLVVRKTVFDGHPSCQSDLHRKSGDADMTASLVRRLNHTNRKTGVCAPFAASWTRQPVIQEIRTANVQPGNMLDHIRSIYISSRLRLIPACLHLRLLLEDSRLAVGNQAATGVASDF